MAGHSKWANIQHRKGAQDAKRGKLFTKLIREITVAARMGDPDPASNPRLRMAVDKALSGNMTKDTIERAIKRGAGVQDGENFEILDYFTNISGSSYGSESYDITPWISADTTVRFRVKAYYGGSEEFFWADNIKVTSECP